MKNKLINEEISRLQKIAGLNENESFLQEEQNSLANYKTFGKNEKSIDDGIFAATSVALDEYYDEGRGDGESEWDEALNKGLESYIEYVKQVWHKNATGMPKK